MAPSHLMDQKARESSFIHKYCRMCALELKHGVYIFGEEGKRLHIPEKIRRTLAILVLEEDTLPKKICTECCSSLEDYALYKSTVLDAQEKLACIAKSLSKSESRQRLHKFESSCHDYEESVISSAESVSEEENDNAKRIQEKERHRKEKSPKKTAHDKIPVKCGICGDIFADESKIISHYGEKHNSLKHQSPIMQCASCSKISLNYKAISRHFRRHHKTNKSSKDYKVGAYHSCKQCGKRYHSFSELMIHVKAKHKNQELPTSPASSVSVSSVVSTHDLIEDDASLMVENVHSPNSDEMPSYSGTSSANNSAGPSSTLVITSKMPVTENNSESDNEIMYKTSSPVKKSSEPVNQVIIEQPLATTTTNSHSPTSKKDDEENLITSKDKIPRRCNICDKLLHSKAGYRSHMLTHEGRRFKCEECEVSYTQKKSLEEHITVHHTNAQKNLSCPMCEKKFLDLKSLNRHKKTHSEPSLEFQCSYCQKTYSTDAYLQRHVKRHTQPPRHLCPTCGKAFFQKRKLEEHINTHSGDKTEGCHFCHKAFSSYSNYVSHVKKVHRNEIDGKKMPPPKKSIPTENNKEVPSSFQAITPSLPSKSTNHVSSQSQSSPPAIPQPQSNVPHSQTHSPIIVPIPQPQIQEAHQHNIPQTPVSQDYHEATEPAHSSTYQIAHQSSWSQMPPPTGKNYQNPSGSMPPSSTSSGNNNASTINALDLVDCAIHHALGSEGNGNSSNPNPPPPSNQHPHHSSHQQIHGNSSSVLSIVHHQSEPMELSYKLDSNPNSFQDMPMELTKVFQRDPLELCVRQDFNNPLMDLSSRVVETGNMGMISGMAMNNMNMNGVCGMGMGISTNNYHKLDLTDRELMDMGAFRQPIDLISRADDGHQLCSEGNLVDLSLRSSFGQDQSASSFLRELIDLSARSDSFHGGELDLTKHPHQHHHSVSAHHIQHHHHHSNSSSSGGGPGGKAINSSLQHVVYQDAMFSLPN